MRTDLVLDLGLHGLLQGHEGLQVGIEREAYKREPPGDKIPDRLHIVPFSKLIEELLIGNREPEK